MWGIFISHFGQRKFDRVGGGVKEGQNMAQNGPRLNIFGFGALYTFCKKGHFPQGIWLKICAWTPKHVPDLNLRAGKWAIPGPEKPFRGGVHFTSIHSSIDVSQTGVQIKVISFLFDKNDTHHSLYWLG